MSLARRHPVPASADPIEFCYERGWTDGLPVVPPTVERVEAMLKGTTLPRETVIAKIPPAWAEATVEKIATTASWPAASPRIRPS